MNIILEVENIKCGGIANTINNKVSAFESVTDIAVDIEAGKGAMGFLFTIFKES